MTILKKLMLVIITVTTLSLTAMYVYAALDPSYSDETYSTTSIAPSTSSLLSNRYTQEEDEEVATNPYVTLDGYYYLGKNDVSNIELYANVTDLSFRIVNLDTGYVWGSSFNYDYFDPENPLYDEGDVGSNVTWQNKFNSPVLVNYFLGSNIKEETFFSAGTTFNYMELTDGRIGYMSHIKFGVSKVELDLYVYIDDQGLHYEIPYDSISDNANTPLASMTLFPFFGSSKRMRTPGYVMIPDGVGALIRIDDAKGKSVYSKRFYGADLGLNLESSESYLYANVYGMVQGVNQNGFLSIVEEGAGNAILTHVPSQNQSDMNWTYVTYEFRTSYTQYLNQSETSSIRLIQDAMNHFDIKQSYTFLEGEDANYVGMANTYQQYLVNMDLLRQNQTLTDISLHLDVLAAENKSALIGRKTFSMTTVNQLQEIIDELISQNVLNLDVTYHGYGNGGYSYTAPNYTKFESKVGSKSEFNTLNEMYGSNVSLFYDVSYPVVSLNNNSTSTKDMAQTISEVLIQPDEDSYTYNIEEAIASLTKDYEDMQAYGVDNLSYDRIGNLLYTNFKAEYSRSEVISYIQQLLEVSDTVAVSQPFSYLWFANVIYDIPMYSSQQSKFSDTVPFYSIVLSGYPTVYGRSSNFFSNTTNELLRMIDYHVYPSFYITYESAYLLLDSGSNNIFTSKFADWEDQIISQYQYVNDALSPVIGATFVSREILNTGFVKNTYSNGVVIYINYSGNDYSDQGHDVSAMSYEVISS